MALLQVSMPFTDRRLGYDFKYQEKRHDKNYILELIFDPGSDMKLGGTVYRVYKQNQPTDERWGYKLTM